MAKNNDNTEASSEQPTQLATARIQQALIKKPPKVSWWHGFIFGGVAGMADASINYPWVSARKMWIDTGRIKFTFQDLYRGCTQYTFGIIPTTAMQFGIFAVLNQRDPDSKSLFAFLSGFGSATFSTASEHLMLTQQKLETTTFKALQSVHQEHGIQRLWTGFIPFGLRDGGYAFGMLRGHQVLKRHLFNNDNDYDLICRVFSGILSAAFTQPFDVIGTKAQCETSKNPRTFLDVVPKIYQGAGIRGFFPGFWLRAGGVSCGVTLMSYVNDKLSERFSPK